MLTVDNWSEKRLVKASQVVRVSPEADIRQLAGLKVNPATAALLLTIGDLRPGTGSCKTPQRRRLAGP